MFDMTSNQIITAQVEEFAVFHVLILRKTAQDERLISSPQILDNAL